MPKQKYRFVHQLHEMDCGRACLKMVGLYYGMDKSEEVDKSLELSSGGNSLYDVSIAAERIGFVSKAVKLSFAELAKLDSPCVLHWKKGHYVVLFSMDGKEAVIGDPAETIKRVPVGDFKDYWCDRGCEEGYALLLLPNANFFVEHHGEKKNLILKNILIYLTRFRGLFFQLFLGFLVGSVIQLMLPFLMQSLVDKGIMLSNMPFVKIILFSQMALLIGRIGIEYIRSWILMHIGIRLNIFILTDFFAKVFNLPIRYFENTTKGDFLQRIDDQKRIEVFFADKTINILFSLLSLAVYSAVIIYYEVRIFWLFVGFSVLYAGWTVFFLPKRKKLDHMRFRVGSEIQTSTIQIIDGMKDIKMYGVERKKRWNWEDIRADLFSFSIKSLTLNQWQQGGSTLINESKNIAVTFLCAKLVMEGGITLGIMMSIQYMLGQLNNPIGQFIGFMQSYQDAKLSIDRLNEMYRTKEEVDPNCRYYPVPMDYRSISFKGVSVKIGAANILSDISLEIERGKITAIVGESGGGKTSLLKLIIGSLKPTQGEVLIGDVGLDRLNVQKWRKHVGVIMQDSFLFADTVIDNVCLSEETVDYGRFKKAIKCAKLDDFLNSLPEKEHHVLANNGANLSQGQRQRILIARILYKSPDIVILDEATNALDSKTEAFVLEGLREVAENKTIIIVTHRLNTIQEADKIIVIEKGKVVGQGSHEELTRNSRVYSALVEKQV